MQVKLAAEDCYQRLRADHGSLIDATSARLGAFQQLDHLAETGRPWDSWRVRIPKLSELEIESRWLSHMRVGRGVDLAARWEEQRESSVL